MNLQPYFPEHGVNTLYKADGTPVSRYTFDKDPNGFYDLINNYLSIDATGYYSLWQKEYFINNVWVTPTFGILFFNTDDEAITEVGDWYGFSDPVTKQLTGEYGVFRYKNSFGDNSGLLWSRPYFEGGLNSSPSFFDVNIESQGSLGSAITDYGYKAYSDCRLIEVLPSMTVNGITYNDVAHIVMYHGTQAPGQTPLVAPYTPEPFNGVSYINHPDWHTYTIELWLARGIGIIQENTPYIENGEYWGYPNFVGGLFSEDKTSWMTYFKPITENVPMNLELNDVTNANMLTIINDNFDKLETELKEKVQYRAPHVGQDNAVKSDIDMDGNNILNIGTLDINDELTFQGQGLAHLFTAAAVAEADLVRAEAAAAEAEAAAAIAVAAIGDNSLSLSKLANVPTDVFLGRDTAGTGSVETITVANARIMLDVNTSGVVDTKVATSAALLTQDLTGPAFSAYQNTNQTITSAAFTKVICDVEEFDSNSCYDVALGRFTPTKPGYYFFSGTVNDTLSTSPTVFTAAVYKNGVIYKQGGDLRGTITGAVTCSGLVYLNGSTDYIELFTYITATTPTIVGGAISTYFSTHFAHN